MLINRRVRFRPAVLALFTAFLWMFSCVGQAQAGDESAYERIMRTGVIRCGFAVWEPTITKDPNTGEFAGVYYDYMEAMGSKLGLEIVWAYELNLATYLEDMKTGKFDVERSGGWPNARRGKFAEYTMPLYYTPVYLYAREGDDRFDNDYESINDASVAKGEFRLVSMLDRATEELMFEGVIDRIMEKHGLDDGVALKPAMPYVLPVEIDHAH